MAQRPDTPAIRLEGITHPRKDVVEVAQYSFGRLKMVAGLAALGSWVAAIWWLFIPVMTGQATPIDHLLGKLGRGYLWGEDPGWAQSYNRECLSKNYYGCSADTTPFEYIALQFHADPKSYIVPLVGLGLLVICAFAWFFIRRPAPVRFNRDIGAIYGTHDGKLWILPASDFDYSYKGEFDLLSGRFFNSGPMRIRLVNARKPQRKRVFCLGAYPPGHDAYGEQLGRALKNFLERSGTGEIIANAPGQAPLKWWQASLFGAARLPEDIDAKAIDWLAEHGKFQGFVKA
ncbi:hypothetical protein [Thalassospira sp. MCCC 1A01428]|uniref:hypothetical protein n=1 Tax=Thalassospira sp. MCCC 1A01428 TaxID=1470575 RepID=UPI000A1EAA15|nr:hypothetical protein [Thalassospira sp. MCCC 1A01428]OSQ38194.1 hypothetical protein THS27_22195 [Thalassospira sp. MCCC 1A01428]